MQGPFDESICSFQSNTVSAEVSKESILCSRNQSVGGRLVSGTCNVCSTPCSSCIPTSQSQMESKVDQVSGGSGMINNLSFSVNDISSSNKTRKCETRQSSEINSAIHTSSSNLSFSANTEVKANARTSDVSSATSDGAVLAKLKDPKSLEGLDDNMSCIVRGDEANKLSSVGKMSGDRSSLQCSSTSSGKTINNQTSAGCVHVKNEADDGSTIGHSRRNESSGEANNKAPSEAISSRNAHSTGDYLENNHSSVKNDVASEASDDLPADTCPEKDDEKSVGSPVSSDTKDALQSHQMDESEDSDIEEQDVKVCDICGDAGREDLLAICCKCTDGAEHTYCMRKMLQKVPEGDWMCEECKFDEEMKNRKEVKSVKLDGNGKSYPTGKIAVGNTGLTIKTESKPSDFDGDIVSDAKISGKRRMDDTEVSSVAKKQALEPVSGSPKTLSPNRLPALSRESSFKNPDKGKLRSANQISSGGLAVHDTPAWGSRTQTSRGTFSKSNSFNSLAAKRKVQLVDEGFLLKQKLVRESVSLDAKESSSRSMGKSMSFRSINTSRNNVSESKVKMLSPKFSSAQDKGQMSTKERNQFERKNSFRSERSPSTSVPSRTDQRSAFRGDPSPLSSSSNIRDSRTGQVDSKPVSLLKSSGAVARRTQDVSVYSDEAKKQISHTSISPGALAANTISSSDQRTDQSSARDDSLSNSHIAERPTSSAGEGLSDELFQPSESKNVGERTKESSGRRLKQAGTGTKSLFCQKCKGSGHLADSCTVDVSELSASDVSAVRNTREAPNGTSNLKAAIEAAMLRKPGICRKNRVLDQSDDLAVSNTNSEATVQDPLSGSSSRRNLSSNEDGYVVSSNSMTGFHKQEIGSLGQLSVPPAEALAGAGNAFPILPSDEKSSLVDLLRYSQATMLILSRTAIPEHEYIWQGAFEVQKSGRILDLCDGIQAHLSSCASPNVVDTVNKFPQRVLFNEVSRLSTWPIQFQEYGVKEDNIALFFFAKDIGSYERCYKTLVENMIRNDTALKANLQGVELLIFPSNRLPEKSQRWNMMFFLWGVFRVKKASCMQHMQAAGKPSLAPQDIPKSVVSFPENVHCLRPVDNVTSANVSMDGEVIASKESGCPLVNGNVDSKVSQVCKGDSADTNVEHLERSSMSTVPSSHMNSALERRQFGIFQVGDAVRECKAEVQSSFTPAANTSSYLSTSEPVPMECGSLLDRQKPFGSVDEAAGHMPEKASVGSTGKGFSSTNGRKFEINLEDEYKDEEASETSGSATTEPTRKALNSDVLNHLKRPHSVETVMHSANSGVNQASRSFNDHDILVERAHYDKKLKTSIGGSYGNSEQTSCSSDDLLSRMHGSSYGPYLPDTGYDEALSKAAIPECSGSAARYFFPVDPNPVMTSSTPWQMRHPDYDRLSDRVPNLELALGGESSLLTQGIPPFLVGKADKKISQDQGGETHLLTQGIPPFLVGKVDKKIIQDQGGGEIHSLTPGIPPFLVGKVDKKVNQGQGGETHSLTPGIPPFLVGKADKKVSQDHSSAKEEAGVEEVEDVSASLSLSLSFPFPDKEQQKGSVSQTEQAIPETRRSNTFPLFFRGLGNK
ncbi:protein PARALOG OF AIPP2-like isoform X2 [Lycium barbarum]|nr:protein PARALOG OF AIPP2-like isoform X2 [Lycium barbarum]XP_060204115.1 protein PARALOG OF AIPP2-like isoform X2 [Lycium barbarum]